jgi:hypothetical protein
MSYHHSRILLPDFGCDRHLLFRFSIHIYNISEDRSKATGNTCLGCGPHRDFRAQLETLKIRSVCRAQKNLKYLRLYIRSPLLSGL